MAFVLTKPTNGGGGGGSAVPGLTITIINGQPTLTLEDTTRADKILSVAENPIMFSENRLGNLDWIQVGNANNANSGYVADFDGTLVFATGQCEDVNGNDKDIHLFVNGADQGTIGSLTGGTVDSFINTLLDIDFNQGDLLRLQAEDGLAGNIQDTIIKLILKWRG